ncbi:MAG: ABC transporter substrate-binding protein [FCB group bacterium]|nr:ABC transporter substrate-binding protein [FCB group bacterium]
MSIRDRVKRISIILGFVIVIGLVFWSSPSEEVYTDGKIHINYWYNVGQEDVIPWPVTAFNESQDRIVVHPVAIPWQESEKKVLTAVISGNPPSLVSQFVPLVKWASRMALRPLDDFIEAENYDTEVFYPALMDEMRYKGRIFGLPQATAAYALYYNKDLFRAAGLNPEQPPQTWDELAVFASAIDSMDSDGRIQRMGYMPDWDNLLPSIMQTSLLMAWQMGATLISEDGAEAQLDDERMAKSLQWVVDYYENYDIKRVRGFRGTFGYDAQHCFISEKVGMFIGSNYIMDNLKRYRPDIDYGVAQIPVPEIGDPSASAAGVFWYAIPRNASHPEAAWEFVTFSIRADIQLEAMKHTKENLFPSNRLTAQDAFFQDDPKMRVFADQMEFAHSPSVVPLAHEVFWRELNMNAVDMVMDKTITVEEALARSNSEVQRELSAAFEYQEYVISVMKFETEE